MTLTTSRRLAAVAVLPLILALGGPGGTVAADAKTAKTGCASSSAWAVKTGTDSQAKQVKLAAIQATVQQLTSRTVSRPVKHRVSPTELTVYSITATVTEASRQHDLDLHLDVNDGSGHNMIVELPDLSCVPKSSPFYSGVKHARSAYAAWHGKLPATGQVTGVGFFDTLDGAPGQAPNGIELHPILSLSFH